MKINVAWNHWKLLLFIVHQIQSNNITWTGEYDAFKYMPALKNISNSNYSQNVAVVVYLLISGMLEEAYLINLSTIAFYSKKDQFR